MKTTDISKMTWVEIQGRLPGTRQAIYDWLLRNGESSTAAMARGVGISLLTVRPRVSEMVTWGMIALVGRNEEGGTYVALPMEHVREICNEVPDRQMDLF